MPITCIDWTLSGVVITSVAARGTEAMAFMHMYGLKHRMVSLYHFASSYTFLVSSITKYSI